MTAALLAVWEDRLARGVTEGKGKDNNDEILKWCVVAGHGEIISDSTAWCSTSMCAAANEAKLPFPPVNVNPMARSWLTMGVTVKLADIQPGDVAVWARGPKPYGHVNCVKDVKHLKTKTMVRCIGGNQGKKGTDGAVTLTDWLDASTALGFRRLVAPTVKDLRAAGSTEIKKSDDLQKAAHAVVSVSSGTAVINTAMKASVDISSIKEIGSNFSVVNTAMEAISGTGRIVGENLWLIPALLCAAVVYWIVHQLRQARIERHKQGVPLSQSVVDLQLDEAKPA